MAGNVYVYNSSDQDVTLTVNGGVHTLPEGKDTIVTKDNGDAFIKFTPSQAIIERNGEPTSNEGKFKSDKDDNCTTELLIETPGQTNGPYEIVIKPSQYAVNRDLELNCYYSGAVLSFRGKVIWSSVDAVN